MLSPKAERGGSCSADGCCVVEDEVLIKTRDRDREATESTKKGLRKGGKDAERIDL